MSYFVNIEDVSDVIETIEKRLYACGLDRAVSIVRHAAAESQKCVWVDNPDVLQKADLSLLSHDGSVRQ